MNLVLDSLAPLVRAVFPTYPYWVPRRFRVVQMHAGDNRVELQAVNPRLGFPDPLPVHVSPGMAGLRAKLVPGTVVVVQFVDGEPTQPVITHFAAAGEPGFTPVELVLTGEIIKLGENALLGIARLTDTVQAGPFSGVITGASLKVKAE